MTKLAPIVIFVYERIFHTRKTVEALLKNVNADNSELFVFSDGAKDQASLPLVQEIRDYIKSIKGFKNIELVESETNKGLAGSIVHGVTEVVNKYGRVIVLEDDTVPSPFFLNYMNYSLDLYQDDKEVCSISGYMNPVKSKLPQTFFLKMASSWGWGTWSDRWTLLNLDAAALLTELETKNLIKKFDLDNSYDQYATLKNKVNGLNQSWAVCWHASTMLKDKLTLYPGKSLIENIGFDGSGVHCRKLIYNFMNAPTEPYELLPEKIEIKENMKARKIVSKHYSHNTHIVIRLFRKLKRLLASAIGQ